MDEPARWASIAHPAALEALTKWRMQPIRVNGAPVVTPNVVQVPFNR